jgi:hypothetical protein
MVISTMKKQLQFFLFFFGTILLSGLIWSGLVYVQLGVPTESSRQLYEVSIHKISNASMIKDRKLLIVSGSNSTYGISAAMLQQSLNMPAVNLGVSAGFQLEYILLQAQKVANPGDVILLPLEYSLYDYNGIPDSVLIDYVFARDVDYLSAGNVWRVPYFVFGVDVIRVAKGLKNRYILADKMHASHEGFNSNGDAVHNIPDTALPLENIKRLSPIKHLVHGISSSSKSWEILDEFVAWSKKRGVKILVTYPAVLFHSSYYSPNALKMVKEVETFWNSRGISILGTYDEFIYGAEYIYDTAYHLNTLGMEIRTRKLIDYLRDFL